MHTNIGISYYLKMYRYYTIIIIVIYHSTHNGANKSWQSGFSMQPYRSLQIIIVQLYINVSNQFLYSMEISCNILSLETIFCVTHYLDLKIQTKSYRKSYRYTAPAHSPWPSDYYYHLTEGQQILLI